MPGKLINCKIEMMILKAEKKIPLPKKQLRPKRKMTAENIETVK